MSKTESEFSALQRQGAPIISAMLRRFPDLGSHRATTFDDAEATELWQNIEATYDDLKKRFGFDQISIYSMPTRMRVGPMPAGIEAIIAKLVSMGGTYSSPFQIAELEPGVKWGVVGLSSQRGVWSYTLNKDLLPENNPFSTAA